MTPITINDFVILRPSSTSAKGAGLFAKRDLEPGHRVICEDPLLKCDSLPQIGSGRPSVRDSLSGERRIQMARLPAGPGDVFQVDASQVPPQHHPLPERWPPHEHGQVQRTTDRDGQVPHGGILHICLVADWTRLHSCTPNSYLCYNELTDSLDLHLVRHVKEGEEITVSYFQDDYAVPKSVRAQRLQKWNFTCPCPCCTTHSDTSDTRRAAIKRLFSDYDQTNIARIMKDVELGRQRSSGRSTRAEVVDTEVWDQLDNLRQIIRHMKEEGLYGLAMKWVLADYAVHLQEAGDLQARRATMRESLQILEMCLGVFHPDTRALAQCVA
ncbi:ABC transporter [Apiospora aurea]|uniref:ABC transporter n=1 Tax=Apiospora aurea TaxID=335848 RepID=A0ABR1PTD7_9PEZI